MDGTKLLTEIARRITKTASTETLTDAELARELGVTQPALSNYKGKPLTPRKVVNLMWKFAKATERRVIDKSVVPLVEFFELEPVETRQCAGWRVFPTTDANPYLRGLRERLKCAHGIYIFHDSRGRAIYAGKAQRLSLLAEMNNAFNRDRGEVQNIKRVPHPTTRVKYRGPEEKRRQISKQSVALHDIAKYISAYQVPESLIGKFEALILRSFANDLLNVRMEHF
jgi:predicted transcriptional regulator